jgi:hypothetical protein
MTMGEVTVAESVRSSQLAPPSVENWYLIIVEPPFDAGAVNGTFICKSPRVGVPNVGTPGGPADIAAVAEESAEPFGNIPFTAVTNTLINFPTKSIALATKLDPVDPAMSEHAVAVSEADVQLFH